MHIDRIPVYRVYQRAIDLELYHALSLIHISEPTRP